MSMIHTANPIRTNHVGYPCYASKRFVYQGSETDFTIARFHDCRACDCYSGRTVKTGGDGLGEGYTVGDFSSVTEEGIYHVVIGENVGWAFIIYDDVYDTVCRVLSNYYVWQRCGDETGWAGECHKSGTLITKDGKIHKIDGGHHQSCDLRKWSEWSTEGMRRLCDTYLLGKPRWDRGNMLYDILHSARYYTSLISNEGYVYDCTFVHEGYNPSRHGKGFGDLRIWWKPMQYYDRPAPAIAEWNTLMFLADASRALADEESELSALCRTCSEKIWNWMQTAGECEPIYDWTVPPPLGHDQFRDLLFRYFYKGSAHMLSGRIAAAAALYRLTGREDYYTAAADAIEQLFALEVKDDKGRHLYFRIAPDDAAAADEMGGFCDVIPLSLADALSVWSDRPIAFRLIAAANGFVDRMERIAATNSFGKTTTLTCPDGKGGVCYPLCSYCDNSDMGATVITLMELAPFTGKKRCLNLTQHLLDWVLGCNTLDSSAIEGVGRNQAPRAITSEFFPPTPQIPGAVITEINGHHFDPAALDAEYDLPIVGRMLYAFALYSKMRR